MGVATKRISPRRMALQLELQNAFAEFESSENIGHLIGKLSFLKATHTRDVWEAGFDTVCAAKGIPKPVRAKLLGKLDKR